MFENIRNLTEKDKRKIARGARCLIGWIVIGVVFALFSGILAGCQKDSEPVMYTMQAAELVWQTNPDNPRQKVPVINDMVYFVMGDER